MTYSVSLHPKARESVERLNKALRRRLIDQLKELRSRPKKGKHRRMGEFYSLRVGEYRAIYEVWKNERKVIILYIGHRRNVYEEFGRWI